MELTRMIWAYTVTELNELQAKDVGSLDEIRSLSKEADWFWIDFLEPNEEEFKVTKEIIEDAEIIRGIEAKRSFPRPERVDGHILFSIPHATFKGKRLEIFPVYLLVKENMLLTVRNKQSSKPVKNVLKTFEDCVGKVCEGAANSSFILSRFFHETSNENLDAVMAIRESIDQIEQEALTNPADKRISRSVFTIKREISKLERILWAQREVILSIREGVVPTINTSEEIKATLGHSINNISRELSLLENYNGALDSVLRLQDLGMIHRVERYLIYLTVLAIFVSVILILLEIDIVSLLSR